MNAQVTDYINKAGSKQKAMLVALRKVIHATVPQVQEDLKWGRPVFAAQGNFAYLKTAKEYVTLGFFNVEKIRADLHLLEGTGKDMRHIKIRKEEDIDKVQLTKWLKAVAG